MFPPESPPPKYRRANPAIPTPEKPSRWVRLFQVLFVVFGIAAIVGLIAFNIKEKTLVCDKNTMGRASLTSFGSCKQQ